MKETILEARNLVKKYGDFAAVKDMNLTIQEGEILSLLGPNGAGKTTLISMLSCLLEPTSGDATIAGHSLTEQPMAVREAIGVVPQEIALYPKLSARENLRFWGQLYGMGGAALKRRVEEVLEMVGLQQRAKGRIETFSGGMKRRINIGVGLLHHPPLIFMDEPTVGIDPQSRRNILDTVQALNEQGMTVLYTTHYMEEAQEISHRIGIMDRGQMIALGTLSELTKLVGEEDVVMMDVDAESIVPELLAALESVPGVSKASAVNGGVRLLVSDGNAVLPNLIGATNAQGVRVGSVDIQEPDLEAVFLHLTGRALRD
jgi:ABC-2 type transport system ATP-binding protein